MSAVWRELWSLFVEDGLLAVGLVAWVVAAALLVPLLGLTGTGGPILFAGAALVLVASVARAARRS